MPTTRLIVDLASIVGRFLHLDDEEYGEVVNFDGKKWLIPSVETSMERIEISFQRALNVLNLSPSQIILVKEPEAAGAARKRAFPFYKATREKRPPQFYAVLNKLTEDVCEMVMKSGGICTVARVSPATEGDDLVNALCEALPDTIVWTGDKDLLSCPATHHYLWDELDPVKFPVPRDMIHLYRAIVTGDASDNIPGCKGFGEKAWEKMLEVIEPVGVRELEDIIQKKELHLLDEKAFPKAALLKEKADDIYASYELMSFIPVPLHKIKWEARCGECDKTLVTADNFAALFPRIKKEIAAADHVTIDYETAVGEEAEEWLAGTYDQETGKQAVMVDVIGSVPTGMGMKVGEQVYYFSVDHRDTNNMTMPELGQVIDLLRNKMVLAQNSSGFENVILHNHFGGMLPGMIDTRLAASYVDENSPLGLKSLSKRWLNYEQETYDQVLAGRKNMREVTGAEVLSYGADDCITADALWNLFSVIMEVEGTFDVFMEVEKDSAFVTSLAFINGIEFDAGVHAKLKAEGDKKITEISDKIERQLIALGWGETECPRLGVISKGAIQRLHKAVTGEELVTNARTVRSVLEAVTDERVREAVLGGVEAMEALHAEYWRPRAELNTRSPKQVQTLLYDTLNCPVRIRNPPTDAAKAKGIYEGSPATSEDAMANAIMFKDCSEEGIALLQDILELKKHLTRESLFFRKLPSLVHWKTGRIHGSLYQCGTTTRRFTHSAPNWAQSSKKKGKEMRNMAKAPDGYRLVALDFAGQELRLQAWHCKDKNFLSCYQGPPEQRKDIHGQMGYTIMTKGEEQLCETYEEFAKLVREGDARAKALRATGKAVVFSSAYGCRPKKLATILRTTEEDATTYLEAKEEAFPGFSEAVKEWNDLCEERGYSTTFLGARRHLAKAFAMAKSQGDKDSVRRLAYSFAIQGSGAEMTKLAMARLWRAGVFEDGKCSMFTIIHDEVVGVIREDLLDEMIPIWHACVTEKYADMDIELESTPEVGTHFGSLKEWVPEPIE